MSSKRRTYIRDHEPPEDEDWNSNRVALALAVLIVGLIGLAWVGVS